MNEYISPPVGKSGIVESYIVSGGDRGLPQGTLLQSYLRLARRWRWVIAGCVAAGFLIALLATLLMVRQYTAAATIEISREEARVVNVDSVQPKTNGADQEFYQTQYGLLVSRSLAERVAKDLKLSRDPGLLRAIGNPQLSGTSQTRLPEAEKERQIGQYLLAHVSIVPARLSQLVTIKYTSPDPDLSARIANAWARAFIQTNIERRFEATAYARTFLVGRLADLRSKLDISERALVQYADTQRIVNVGTPDASGKVGGERPITSDDLVAYNDALTAARTQRIAADSAFKQAQRAGGSTTTSVTNQAINTLRGQRAEVAANYSKLRAQFETDYPPLQSVAAQLQQLDKSIAAEEARVIGSLRSEYLQSAQRENELSARVETLKGDLLDLKRRSIQYNILQREVDTNRTLYDGLLQRYKEIGIAGGVGTNNVAIVDPADVPTAPSSPRTLINLMLGILAGAITGAAVAFALDQIDEKLTDPAELEQVIGVPSLGVVPKIAEGNLLEVLEDRRSAVTEAYLTIKTNLQFSTPHGFPKSMLVSSTRPAEGKSTTALALALILSRQQRKVVLIDADMRSPTVHTLIGASNDVGLSNILSGNARWKDIIVANSGLADVQVIPAGPHPPNAADLLSGAWLQLLIEELTSEFDHVIIDAPPMLGLADATLIGTKVDGVVYIVESGGLPSRAIKLAVNRLLSSGVNLMGVVLTKFVSTKSSYGYGYDYGYGYGSAKSAEGSKR